MKTQHHDIVIIGAGSAGCVLANRLSARHGLRVALIEAGGRDRDPWRHIPAGGYRGMHSPRIGWCYQSEPQTHLHGRSLAWPRGKTLGGSSAIGGLLYVRGQRADFDAWRELGNAGWGWDEVLPYFMRGEDQERGADEFHGRGGPLPVSNVRERRNVCDAFIRAAEQLGIAAIHDYNTGQQDGACHFQFNARNGLRCSSADAFLKPVQRRANLHIVTDAHVERVCFEGRRASGVAFYRHGEPHRALAAREVVLCAGTIGSAQILQLSGIGAASALRAFGINVVQDLAGVGRNLQDHLQFRAIYRSAGPTLNDAFNQPLRAIANGLRFALTRGGPLSAGAAQVAVFARSHADLATPDLLCQLQALSADHLGGAAHRYGAFTIAVCPLRPTSRGHIALKSADPWAYPAIEANYFATRSDRQTAIDGLKLARRLCGSHAMRPFVARELRPGIDVQSDAQWLEAARDLAETACDPVGTCKMGSDRYAVVDDRLRVHGVAGLRVADASIMPTITSGGTYAPTVMIAEKASDLILAER